MHPITHCGDGGGTRCRGRRIRLPVGASCLAAHRVSAHCVSAHASLGLTHTAHRDSQLIASAHHVSTQRPGSASSVVIEIDVRLLVQQDRPLCTTWVRTSPPCTPAAENTKQGMRIIGAAEENPRPMGGNGRERGRWKQRTHLKRSDAIACFRKAPTPMPCAA